MVTIALGLGLDFPFFHSPLPNLTHTIWGPRIMSLLDRHGEDMPVLLSLTLHPMVSPQERCLPLYQVPDLL